MSENYKLYEKHRSKKVKGKKYFKNKKRGNVTLVYSDAVAKPEEYKPCDIEKYELTSQESNSICSSPKKRVSRFKYFKIDTHEIGSMGNSKIYDTPVIVKAEGPHSAKSFENQLGFFKT